jgi:hypothetical protein
MDPTQFIGGEGGSSGALGANTSCMDIKIMFVQTFLRMRQYMLFSWSESQQNIYLGANLLR